MKLPDLEKISVSAIAEAVGRLGHAAARAALSGAIGAPLDVSGKVLKRITRDGQCKLLIQPGDVSGFVVFADCLGDAATVRARKIRKGSTVTVGGQLLSFGYCAVCLSGCYLRSEKRSETT